MMTGVFKLEEPEFVRATLCTALEVPTDCEENVNELTLTCVDALLTSKFSPPGTNVGVDGVDPYPPIPPQVSTEPSAFIARLCEKPTPNPTTPVNPGIGKGVAW
jgi:hypothetical protein